MSKAVRGAVRRKGSRKSGTHTGGVGEDGGKWDDERQIIRRMRYMAADDAPAAAPWLRKHEANLRPLDGSLQGTLSRLITESRLLAACIERRSADGEWDVEAMALSGFLTEQAADRYFDKPPADIDRDLLSRCATGGAAAHLLSADDVSKASPTRGLDLAVLGLWQTSYDHTCHNGRRLLAMTCKMVEDMHRGYRIARVLLRTRPELEPIMKASGFRKLITGAAPRRDGVRRADGDVIGVLSEAEAAAQLPVLPMMRLFEWERPRFRLSPGQKAVIELALRHLSDAEIAVRLGLTIKAVQTRWWHAYEKIGKIEPELAGSHAHRAVGRGPESRRRVLAYIHDHPEEVRPYDHQGEEAN